MDKIYFYAPDKSTHHSFKQEHYSWTEIVKTRKTQSGNFTSWIVSTYLQMKQAGLTCEVVDRMPEKGIVIADRDSLGNQYPFVGQTLLICAKGDREFHPSAHIHIVHNPLDQKDRQNLLWNPYYIPHWPQPGLIPRSDQRGTLVENIAFVGSRSNLTNELLSERWIEALKSLGCQWLPIFNPSQWSDYSHIDVVVAARSFSDNPYRYKPASKLINCWRAGVPAVLTPESAFLAVKKTDLDFLIIRSLDEAIEAIQHLKNHPEFYWSMVQNGRDRAQHFSEEAVLKHWLSFFQEHIGSEYEKWMAMSDLTRNLLFARRYTYLKANRLQNRIFDQSSRLLSIDPRLSVLRNMQLKP